VCGYGEVYAGVPIWVCTGWKERIGKREMVSETGGGARFETRGIPSSRRKNDGMCSRGVGVLVSSTLRGVLVPGCRDDNWRMPAAGARLGVVCIAVVVNDCKYWLCEREESGAQHGHRLCLCSVCQIWRLRGGNGQQRASVPYQR
jgi:hypothetical protein